MLRQPHRQRAQTADRQEHVIRSGANAEQLDRVGHQRPGLGIGRDRAEHDVGVAADIFRCRLHADVDALLQRAVKQRRGPGVVVDHERAARMCDRGDRGDIGHFEGLRSRRLDQHRFGVRLEQPGDAGADQRIEIAGLDAIAGEQAVAEISCRAVGIVADQEMIAGFQHREQRRGDRRQARGRNPDAGALRAFKRHQRLLQRLRGRGSATAILELAAMGVQIVGGRIQHGRAVDHRRIDESLLRLGIAPGSHQRGLCLPRLRYSIISGGFHGFAVTKDLLPQPRRPFVEQTRRAADTGADLLITGHRRGPSTP